MAVKFINFLKRLIFKTCYCFWMFWNKLTVHVSHVRISQKVKGISTWNLQHITFIWRQILADFQICISVPLSALTDNSQLLRVQWFWRVRLGNRFSVFIFFQHKAHAQRNVNKRLVQVDHFAIIKRWVNLTQTLDLLLSLWTP